MDQGLREGCDNKARGHSHRPLHVSLSPGSRDQAVGPQGSSSKGLATRKAVPWGSPWIWVEDGVDWHFGEPQV